MLTEVEQAPDYHTNPFEHQQNIRPYYLITKISFCPDLGENLQKSRTWDHERPDSLALVPGLS